MFARYQNHVTNCRWLADAAANSRRQAKIRETIQALSRFFDRKDMNPGMAAQLTHVVVTDFELVQAILQITEAQRNSRPLRKHML